MTFEEFLRRKEFTAADAKACAAEAAIQIENDRQKTIANETEELTRRVWESIRSAVARGKTDTEVKTDANGTGKGMQPESVQNVVSVLTRNGFSVSQYSKLQQVSISWS